MSYTLNYTKLADHKYRLNEPVQYYSERYGKWITVEGGFISDGSTGWFDMASLYWWVHDKLCKDKKWDDGTSCSRWQSSMVLGDIAREDGCYITGTMGVIATWLAGLF